MRYLPLLANVALVLFLIFIRLLILLRIDVFHMRLLIVENVWIVVIAFLLTCVLGFIFKNKLAISLCTLGTSLLGVALYFCFYSAYQPW